MSQFASPLPYQPMTIGQVLDRTYRLTRTNLRLFMTIALVPAGVFIVILAALEAAFFIPLIRQFPKPPSPETIAHLLNPAFMATFFALLLLFYGVIFGLYFAAANHAATQADRSFATSFRESCAFACANAGRYLWLIFLTYVLTFLPALVLHLATFAGATYLAVEKPNPNPALFLLVPLGMLLILAAFVYGILMALRLSLAFPACVVEGLPARAALKRSGHLTQGAKGRIFLVLFVVYLILYAAVMIFEVVVMFFAALAFLLVSLLHIQWAPPWSYIAIGCGVLCLAAFMLLYTALSWTVLTSALAVLYHDQRLRTDPPLPAPVPSGAPA